MAGFVPANHGLKIDPAEAVDACLRWHDEDSAQESVSTAASITV
jgi:hypothetical protein